MAICLPGIASKSEARRHFGHALRTVGDDDQLHDDENDEHEHADYDAAAHDEVAERRNVRCRRRRD